MRLAWLTGRHRSTCWKVLKRHGVSRQRRTVRAQSTRRYEWTEAGALLHIDAFELPKFDRPGHWAHGDRSEAHRTRQAGTVKVIGVIDDHTRLAYCEIHAAENKHTVSATLKRAAAWMTEQGCGPTQAVMSDNALCYARSTEFRATLTELGARHILIPPRTPRWNGKIERFFRTLDTEWAHSHVWPDQHPTRPRPVIVPALLQPPQAAHRRRRPTTHHPRSARPRAGQLAPGVHEGMRRRRHADRYAPAWLRPAHARQYRDTHDPWRWKRLDGPRWWASLADTLTRGRETADIADYLRRRGRMGGLEARSPLLDLRLVELALRIPPETSFDPVTSRPLVREALRGALPPEVLARKDKRDFAAMQHETLQSDREPRVGSTSSRRAPRGGGRLRRPSKTASRSPRSAARRSGSAVGGRGR